MLAAAIDHLADVGSLRLCDIESAHREARVV
jgi:hypothetical protein